MVVLAIFLFCTTMPTYIGLHPASSIVTFDYGYVTSMAFLHDVQPVIFIGLLLLLLFMISIYMVRSFLAFLDNIRTSPRGREKSGVSTSTSWGSKAFALRHYLIFFALNLINLAIVMSVNIAYVNTTSYNRSELLIVQISVGLFTAVWNGVFVPWSCDWLATFSSYRSSMRGHRYVMSIINYIIAPVVSTIIYSESCFYYVFNAAAPVSSILVLSVLGAGFYENSAGRVDPLCELSFPISINTASVSSFDYSYACGESLIVAYTPVLISSYLFSGLFKPLLQLALAFDNPISRFAHIIVTLTTNFPSSYAPQVRVRGRDVAVMLMVHSTVLFSFGLASPLMIIPIAFLMVTDCITCRLLIGKTLLENDAKADFEKRIDEAIRSEDQKIMNPIVQSDVALTTDASKTSNHAGPSLSIQADLLTMEHLDMGSSWEAIDACFHLMIVFVMLFWALLFFDMIADVYGTINGVIMMTRFAILPASCLIVVDNANLIPRMISSMQLDYVCDSCMATMIGLGAIRSKVSNNLEAVEGAAAAAYVDDIDRVPGLPSAAVRLSVDVTSTNEL